MPTITESDRQPQPGETPPRRLKLVMPHSQGQSQAPPSTDNAAHQHESSGSPTRPSYSPVTPTLSQPALAPQSQYEPGSRDLWMREPEAPPVSLDENTDAIAMRAAISILQMQRQQSLKGIKDLEKMRKAAADDPEAFINDLKSGRLTPQPRIGVGVDDDDASDDEQPDAGEDSQFGKFPAPQNVVRAPPVEWSKYHIMGEPLDRMHEIQRRYPGFKEEMLDAVQKPQPHTIASPYKAFADKLDDPHTPPQRDDDG